MQKPIRRWSYALVGLCAWVVYWLTSYPTINWWDSSSYSLASHTMAVVGPPGSLLLTLLGWPLTRLAPNASIAHVLNLFAAVFASLTTVIVYAIALRLLKLINRNVGTASQLGTAFGALTLAFSATMWDYATQFTPYMLTTVCTALTVWQMLRWWEDAEQPDAWNHFAWLGLIIGIDFSVHRTNALLAPSVLMWVVVRDVKTLLNWRVWVAGAATMIAALSLQLLYIPISRSTHSLLNWSDTGTLESLWSFIALDRLGGGFLVKFWPRNAPFLKEQVGDVLRTFSANFFHWHAALQLLGISAGIVGCVGIAAMWRRNRRFGFAFTALLFLQGMMTILYFNIPEQYFRSLNRHYLPICATFGIAIAVGAAVIANSISELMASPDNIAVPVAKRMLAVFATVFIASLPIVQLVENWTSRDGSSRFFAYDYARNSLSELPPNAIYFTAGDNDTFPVLYVQDVEGMRPDVRLVNLSLLADPSYAKRLVREDSSLPIPTTRTLHDSAKPDWADSTLADVMRLNAGRRPITFAITSTGAMSNFRQFTRLEGFYYRAMQQVDSPIVLDSLRANLFRHEYRGYADSNVAIDDATRGMGNIYYVAFNALLEADSLASPQLCQRDRTKITHLVPPGRLNLDAEFMGKLARKC